MGSQSLVHVQVCDRNSWCLAVFLLWDSRSAPGNPDHLERVNPSGGGRPREKTLIDGGATILVIRADLNRSDRLVLLGVAILSIGVYLPWAVAPGGPLMEYTTLQSTGIYFDRVVLLVPILLVAVLRGLGWNGWGEVFSWPLAVGPVRSFLRFD